MTPTAFKPSPAEGKKDRVRVTLRQETLERLAKRLVRYRIPMAVTCVMECPGSNYYPVCPGCKRTIEREYMVFCNRCGQKLGWKKYHKARVVYPGEFSGVKWD